MDYVILSQGKFTSDGTTKQLSIRSDVDFMWVYNYTQAATQQGTGRGVKFYWQRGMAANTGIEYKKTNSTDALNMVTLTSGGFTLLDTSADPVAFVSGSTISAVSAAAIPVATNTGTNGLVAGDIVRLFDITGAQQLGNMDFTVGYNTLSTTTFSLDYMPQIVAGTTGSWCKIKFNPIYYPRHRSITKVTSSGTSTVVTTSVTHGFNRGMRIKFIVPAAYGMTQLNNLYGTITAIDTTTTTGNTFTVDIDSSTFTAFSFPLTAAAPFTQALAVPAGMNTAYARTNSLDDLADRVENQAIIGMSLAAGAQSPAGSSNDVIYWVAGKSFSVNNE